MATITEKIGDIFSAPAGSILIHACNAKGSWGAGVALAFKNKYPQAFKIYTNHCKTRPPTLSLPAHQTSIVGTTLLIPPQEAPQSPSQPPHWIACLFTSLNYGRNVDSTPKILQNTERALNDLVKQLQALHPPLLNKPNSTTNIDPTETQQENSPTTPSPARLYAVRINSGKFGVPWPRTKQILNRSNLTITVFRPEDQAEDQAEDQDQDQDKGKGPGPDKDKDANKDKAQSQGGDKTLTKKRKSNETPPAVRKKREREVELEQQQQEKQEQESVGG